MWYNTGLVLMISTLYDHTALYGNVSIAGVYLSRLNGLLILVHIVVNRNVDKHKKKHTHTHSLRAPGSKM